MSHVCKTPKFSSKHAFVLELEWCLSAMRFLHDPPQSRFHSLTSFYWVGLRSPGKWGFSTKMSSACFRPIRKPEESRAKREAIIERKPEVRARSDEMRMGRPPVRAPTRPSKIGGAKVKSSISQEKRRGQLMWGETVALLKQSRCVSHLRRNEFIQRRWTCARCVTHEFTSEWKREGEKWSEKWVSFKQSSLARRKWRCIWAWLQTLLLTRRIIKVELQPAILITYSSGNFL